MRSLSDCLLICQVRPDKSLAMEMAIKEYYDSFTIDVPNIASENFDRFIDKIVYYCRRIACIDRGWLKFNDDFTDVTAPIIDAGILSWKRIIDTVSYYVPAYSLIHFMTDDLFGLPLDRNYSYFKIPYGKEELVIEKDRNFKNKIVKFENIIKQVYSLDECTELESIII